MINVFILIPKCKVMKRIKILIGCILLTVCSYGQLKIVSAT